MESSLTGSLLFQHDIDEVSLWLDALPSTDADGEDEDEDEDASITISFLDDCAQRYTKTPYKYIEELRKIPTSEDGAMDDDSADPAPAPAERADAYPSPLLMVVIEQIGAKTNSQKPVDAEIHAAIRFLHRLFLRLASKTPSLFFIRRLIDYFVSKLRLSEQPPSRSSEKAVLIRRVQDFVFDLSRIDANLDLEETAEASSDQLS